MLHPGDFFVLPSGSIHAVFSTEDSLAITGAFLCEAYLPAMVDGWRRDKRLRSSAEFTFPDLDQMVESFVRELVNQPNLQLFFQNGGTLSGLRILRDYLATSKHALYEGLEALFHVRFITHKKLKYLFILEGFIFYDPWLSSACFLPTFCSTSRCFAHA